MISETKPDIVIVTDHRLFSMEIYIVRALELGCNVITEKPIAIDAEQCQRIADTENRTGGKKFCRVQCQAHENEAIEMKKILLSGELGKIIAIEYQERTLIRSWRTLLQALEWKNEIFRLFIATQSIAPF